MWCSVFVIKGEREDEVVVVSSFGKVGAKPSFPVTPVTVITCFPVPVFQAPLFMYFFVIDFAWSGDG